MCAEKCDSMIKESLKNLCCSNGWCYGVFWGFDHRKTLLLTLKDAYYEQQMGAMIDSMLLQVHVLGGGEIGQVAFTQNHRWIYSDTQHDRRNSLTPFENLEVFQDGSEFYSQFCMGIKTIALISVEPWGVVQFGSTQKNLETKDFVDRVKKLFIGMDVHPQVISLKNEPLSDSQFLDSTTQFSSLLSSGLKNGALNSEGFIDPNHSLIDGPIQISTQSTNQIEDYLLESTNNLFDCSASHLTSDVSNNRNFTSLIPQTDFKAKTPSGLLTSDGFFQESGFAEPVSNPGLEDNEDLSRWFAPLPGPNTTSLTALLTSDLSHSTGLVPLSCLSENNSPVFTNSIQSSITDALRSNNPQVKPGCNNKPLAWDETLIPVGPSKTRASNSLFSQLGIDQLLDGTNGTGSCSYAQSGSLEDQSSSAAKRRKIDSFSSGYNRVKSEDVFGFDGKMKSFVPVFEPETRNIGLHREQSSYIGDSCIMDGVNTASSSDRQDEPAKTAKKKAKPGTKPRPKDRQMIQDRLAELRELIPCGEKMSIDRLLERTIRHLNFMQSLTKHAESLKQIHKPKSGGVPRNQSSKGDGGGGVTWACEVGDQSMVCPLIVEDLVSPGQMLIEILCEEKGFFLEIVDIIRGFGLIILKGVMEVREPKKIWAHFLVQAEGTRHVTRHEIFSSLIQLLQMGGQSVANAGDSFGNDVISPNVPSFNNCPFPVNLAGGLQCGNL